MGFVLKNLVENSNSSTYDHEKCKPLETKSKGMFGVHVRSRMRIYKTL